MITYADLIEAHPELKAISQEQAQVWIDAANSGLKDARFKGPGDRARLLFVAHNLTKPATVAPKSITDKKPHAWASTHYGKALLAGAKY